MELQESWEDGAEVQELSYSGEDPVLFPAPHGGPQSSVSCLKRSDTHVWLLQAPACKWCTDFYEGKTRTAKITMMWGWTSEGDGSQLWVPASLDMHTFTQNVAHVHTECSIRSHRNIHIKSFKKSLLTLFKKGSKACTWNLVHVREVFCHWAIPPGSSL